MGDLLLEPCDFKTKTDTYIADCGTLIVPENRTNPESQLITLPVVRIRAKNNRPTQPIFYLEGGPGMSNMHAKPPSELLVNHDFVMVGYRGVDGLIKLDCPELAYAIKGDGLDVLSTSSLARLSTAMRQCSTRLQNDGIDLDGYTILEVIADIEAVRQGLGYEHINLFSLSYGTRVAQLYANQYPQQIHRSIMIGVNLPGHFVWEPAMVDAQIRHYSELYIQTGNPLVPDLAQAMFNISHNMPDRWLFFKIDLGKVKIVTLPCFFTVTQPHRCLTLG